MPRARGPCGSRCCPAAIPARGAVELGLRAVPAGGHEHGDAPPLAAGRPLLALAPGAIVLSALKPAEDGDGLVVRVLNPTDEIVEAVIDLGFPVDTVRPVRLDESPADDGELGARATASVSRSSPTVCAACCWTDACELPRQSRS